MKKTFVGLLGISLALVAPVWAGEGDKCCPPPQKPLSKAMEQIKTLAGRWEGTDPMNPKEKAVVEYRVTAGGTALVETLFPGKPQEMVSVYHDRNGRLVMTHYCLLGNQPHLTLVNQEPNKLAFALKGKTGLTSAKEPHMHAFTLTWKDQDNIVFEGVGYENGKKKDSCVLALSRVKK